MHPLERSRGQLSRDQRWALVRLGLGTFQVFGAGASLVLLMVLGLTGVTVGAILATTLATTVSVLLFGSRRAK